MNVKKILVFITLTLAFASCATQKQDIKRYPAEERGGDVQDGMLTAGIPAGKGTPEIFKSISAKFFNHSLEVIRNVVLNAKDPSDKQNKTAAVILPNYEAYSNLLEAYDALLNGDDSNFKFIQYRIKSHDKTQSNFTYEIDFVMNPNDWAPGTQPVPLKKYTLTLTYSIKNSDVEGEFLYPANYYTYFDIKVR